MALQRETTLQLEMNLQQMTMGLKMFKSSIIFLFLFWLFRPWVVNNLVSLACSNNFMLLKFSHFFYWPLVIVFYVVIDIFFVHMVFII